MGDVREKPGDRLVLPHKFPWLLPVRRFLPTVGHRLPRKTPVWPDPKHPLAKPVFDDAPEAAWNGPPPVLLAAEAANPDELLFLAHRAVDERVGAVILPTFPLTPALQRELPDRPRLLRVIARGDESEFAWLVRAGCAAERLFCFAFYRLMWHALVNEAIQLRTTLELCGEVPPRPALPERAPLATTLWDHVLGVSGFLFPQEGSIHKVLGTCPETARRVRRMLPKALVAAVKWWRRAGKRRPDPRNRAAAIAVLHRLEALIHRLEDDERAQAKPRIGEHGMGLFRLEARSIEAELRRAANNVAEAARRLMVGEDRVRPHRRH